MTTTFESCLAAIEAAGGYTLPAVVFGALLFVAERRWPARPLPRVRGWWARVIGLQLGMVAVGLVGAATWQVAMPAWSPWRVSVGPGWVDGLLAYLVSTVVFYGWHRVRHRSRWCWRFFHQIHHSPVRVEAVTAFYSHPAEVLASSVVLAAVVYLLLGMDASAYGWCALYSAWVGLFYHANLRVPHGWSYVVQTPDLHRVHHARGRHAGNYADLPVLDLLGGTFVHPARFGGETGFADDREQALGAMLAGADVETVADLRR